MGISASGKYNSYCCRTYLQKGRAACDAPLINKEKLEQAVLDQIQDQILSEQNVRKYIELIVSQAGAAKAEPSAEEKAVEFSIMDVALRIGVSSSGGDARTKASISLELCSSYQRASPPNRKRF